MAQSAAVARRGSWLEFCGTAPRQKNRSAPRSKLLECGNFGTELRSSANWWAKRLQRGGLAWGLCF